MIRLVVPATTANLGPGFDTLGMAMGLCNHFSITESPQDNLNFSPLSSADTTSAEINPSESLFFRALDTYCNHRGIKRQCIRVTIEAHIPLARGLGSSSTVIVAGLLAGSILSERNEKPLALLNLATQMEGHPDNVAPALLGGVQMCVQEKVYPLPWPPDWGVVFMVPPYPLSTHIARQVMPATYDLKQAVTNLQYTGLLVHALHTADEQAMRQALQDTLHQPYRLPLIPEFETVRQVAAQAGALGTVISGAGPTLAIFTTGLSRSAVNTALDIWINTQTESGYKRLDLPVISSFNHQTGL